MLRTVAENIFLGRESRKCGLIQWPAMNAKAVRLLTELDAIAAVGGVLIIQLIRFALLANSRKARALSCSRRTGKASFAADFCCWWWCFKVGWPGKRAESSLPARV